MALIIWSSVSHEEFEYNYNISSLTKATNVDYDWSSLFKNNIERYSCKRNFNRSQQGSNSPRGCERRKNHPWNTVKLYSSNLPFRSFLINSKTFRWSKIWVNRFWKRNEWTHLQSLLVPSARHPLCVHWKISVKLFNNRQQTVHVLSLVILYLNLFVVLSFFKIFNL